MIDAPSFPVCFDSTDDAELDTETSLLEDDPDRLETGESE